ncbi:MAG: hypothetical protein GY869_03750 [Planctomycetes bacterium]|nr:hypothetical protein [Planctomycetota bacterium]
MNISWTKYFLIGLFFAVLLSLGGCVVPMANSDVGMRLVFDTYDKVAIWGSLSRQDEEEFIPLWMSSFPKQTLVERRDLESIMGEQDILPERLDNATRAEIRRILGVKGLIYPSFSTSDQFSVKVIDTETGEIVASVLIREASHIPFASESMKHSQFIRKAIDSLRNKLKLITD